VVEEAINNVLPPPAPEEQQLLHLADVPQQNLPFLPVNHVNMVVEEFPFEQLMDGNEVNLPDDGSSSKSKSLETSIRSLMWAWS